VGRTFLLRLLSSGKVDGYISTEFDVEKTIFSCKENGIINEEKLEKYIKDNATLTSDNIKKLMLIIDATYDSFKVYLYNYDKKQWYTRTNIKDEWKIYKGGI